jgi:hypothetical protein
MHTAKCARMRVERDEVDRGSDFGWTLDAGPDPKVLALVAAGARCRLARSDRYYGRCGEARQGQSIASRRTKRMAVQLGRLMARSGRPSPGRSADAVTSHRFAGWRQRFGAPGPSQTQTSKGPLTNGLCPSGIRMSGVTVPGLVIRATEWRCSAWHSLGSGG